MENRIFGVLTIFTVSLLCYFALNKFKKNQFDKCLYLIVLVGLILRIFTACDFYLHAWDERYHALVAKNLLSDPFTPMLYSNPILDYDFRNWASNHVWVHKQPFPLYTMALSMLMFGKNVLALRLPSILLSTFAIISTYKIGEFLITKRVGIIAAFLFAINGLIIEQTAGRVATDHIDVFFFSLISFALYYGLKSIESNSKTYIILSAVFTGLAILSKWLPALIVFPLWLIYGHAKHSISVTIKQSVLYLTIVSVIVLPWQLYINYYFPMEAVWESAYNMKHIFEAIAPHGQPFYYHFDKMRIIFGELIYLPILWLIYISFKKTNNPRNLFLLIWILVPYLFFSFVQTKMQGYILFCAPAIFILIALFFEYLWEVKSKYYYIPKIIAVLLLLLPVRYSIERVKPFSDTDRSPIWISEMMAIDMEEKNSLKVIFNCKYPIETMFYTDFTAYEIIPPINKLKSLTDQGYSVYIDNYNDSITDLVDIPFIKFVKITGNN